MIAVVVFRTIAVFRAASDESITDPQLSSSKHTDRKSSFACNMLAMTPEIRKRHFEEVGPALLRLKKGTRELANGYEFEFPADEKTFQLLTEWAMQERLCCPFFAFQIDVGSDGQPLWLRITGREGVKSFMQSEFGIK